MNLKTTLATALDAFRDLWGADTVFCDGLVLPPKHLRFCGAEFKDDDYFLDSARREVDRLVTQLNLDRNAAVLDIGCGPGRLAIALRERFADLREYCGLDVNQRSLTWCKRHLASGPFRFEQLDVQNARYNPQGTTLTRTTRLPLPDEHFDIAYLFSVFSHMEQQDVECYLSEMQRSLRQGGKVFLTAFVADEGGDVTVNPRDDGMKWRGPLHCVRYRQDAFEAMLESRGFHIQRCDFGAEIDGQTGYYLRKK